MVSRIGFPTQLAGLSSSDFAAFNSTQIGGLTSRDWNPQAEWKQFKFTPSTPKSAQ